jgi:hypothetical protein
VSISIDKLKDIEKWKSMIKNKRTGWSSGFRDVPTQPLRFEYYRIPRFILIDPNGKS